ncbi:1,4-alpha-glucan branching protein [Streptomyces sp. NPDC002138]|uniref:maltokinase N-terminal cap-like domain-containing protein n=1 Tax=Streptomyces sp. NPDC002138 TaxID=3154410 RepID=UPI00331F6E1E
MAIIHKTTMNPGKMELLAAWLPQRPWYLATGRPPAPVKAGGFRLDDPQGEVGVEIMVVTDTSGERPHSYHLPVTYRAAPLEGAEAGLIGTSEHGVLGRRWVYDGTHDPVCVALLLALIQGRAAAQHQNLSEVPEPSVTARYTGPEVPELPVAGQPEVADGAEGTEVVLPGGALLGVTRVLLPLDADAEKEADGEAPAGAAADAVVAAWTTPDGAAHRGVFASLSFGPPVRAADVSR